MPRGSVHAHTGRLRPVVSRVDTSGGSVHLHTGRLRSGVTWGDTRIASAVLVPDFRVNPVPCIASAVLESSTVPTGWPRSYTVCGPTYPITGQKSEGESQRGIDMCVWLCFPAGCRLWAAPQRACHLWSVVLLQPPAACSPNSCAYRTPSLVPPTPVLLQGSTVRIRIPFAAILSGHVCGGTLYMHQ